MAKDGDAQYKGLKAIGWADMIKTWWGKTLAGLIITAIVLGSLFILFNIFKRIRNWWTGRSQLKVVPPAVVEYFEGLKSSEKRLAPHRELTTKRSPASFGVYLGSFSTPPTSNQARLLSQWEITVVDPLQTGVLEAIASHCNSKHIVGRLDVGEIARSDSNAGQAQMLRALEKVVNAMHTSFKRPEDIQTRFTGVVFADLHTRFPPLICNELLKYVDSIGLDIFFEITPPSFLPESQCHEINMTLVRGLLCRNGSIMSNGDRRNYYQMSTLRPAINTLAMKYTKADPIYMMWETIDDDVRIEHAVVKRSFTWCTYQNCINWIGPCAAVTDADIATTHTLPGEPISAFVWLKDEELIRTGDVWRFNDRICQEEVGDHSIYDSLKAVVPNLAAKLALMPSAGLSRAESAATMIDDLEWPPNSESPDPFSLSPQGKDYTGLGCFPIGLNCSDVEFSDVVEGQRRLRDLEMLNPLKPEKLHNIGERLMSLYDPEDPWAASPDVQRAIRELIDLLMGVNGDDSDRIKVYLGLDSGFRCNNGLESLFWGVYEVEAGSGHIDIFISQKAKDLPSTLLHTFMSCRGWTRSQCFMTEIALAEQTDTLNVDWLIPSRLVQDIEQLTPTEAMLFVRRLALSSNPECPVLSDRVRSYCEHQLIEVPTIAQLRALNATAYLRGDITAEDLINSRIAWYQQQGCRYPDPASALSLFLEIDAVLPGVLIDQQADITAQIVTVLDTVIKKYYIDASADIFALAIFCAFRRLAIQEVYLEVLDRNPLPNQHPDQAACFAEMFALGSRCDSYFDMTPNVLGRLIADKQQAYYKEFQPPTPSDTSTEMPTAYSSKNVELNPHASREKVPMHYQVTFLGIFAIPALVDILLLTTLGRGLYVTAYMRLEETSMATTGLMVALFVTGAVGTWIGSGGSYYLHCMAFSAMNMFVLSRLVAGFAICFGGGLLAFIIIAATKSPYAGLIFMLYFILLSMYLLTLSALSIYQMPGFMFQSGRIVIMMCMPILLVSPIVTLWFHHDIAVYVIVLTVFVSMLLFGARHVMAQWATWYLRIELVSDKELATWFEKLQPNLSEEEYGPAPLGRDVLLSLVLKERNKKPWQKASTDQLVLRMAKSYPSTIFLMDWYCKYTRTKTPFIFSSTWNLQCKAAIDTLRDLQKGLKLHNAFLHWRHAGEEVSCGVLYFVIALMDKWVAIITGGNIVGLSDAGSETFRLAVGFGLAYYLISAVFLDGVSQPLWARANKTTPQPIASLAALKEVAIGDARAKRNLYWGSFVKLFFLHVWSLSITAAIMWSFEASAEATIMYLAYISAYTGLLWYQYNRIFTGPVAFKDLLVAAVFGLAAGITMHKTHWGFAYNSVIALGVSTWTAAILTLWSSKIFTPKFRDESDEELGKTTPIYHHTSGLKSDAYLTQADLAEIYEEVSILPADQRHKLHPLTYPGVEVLEIFSSGDNVGKTQVVHAAFSEAHMFVRQISELWKSGDITVELVPERSVFQREQKMRSICQTVHNQLNIFIFIGPDIAGEGRPMDIRRNCRVIAEAIIQATAECKFGFSLDHSKLMELIAVPDLGDRMSPPEGVKRQIEQFATERKEVINNGDKELLRHLLLGMDADTKWDDLPRSMRVTLLKRCTGESYNITGDQLDWISTKLCGQSYIDPEEYVARCNLGVSLASATKSYAAAVESRRDHRDQPESIEATFEQRLGAPLPPRETPADKRRFDWIITPLKQIRDVFTVSIKFFVVALVAEPEFQRELDHVLSTKPVFISWPLYYLMNSLWIFCHTLQDIIYPIFLFHGREKVATLYSNMKGMKTVIKRKRIVIETISGDMTGFHSYKEDGTQQLHLYTGKYDAQPTDYSKLVSVNTYSGRLLLLKKEEYAKGEVINVYEYYYPDDGKNSSSKIPDERRCTIGKLEGQIVQYDKFGYIASGSTVRDGNPVDFQYFYRKHAKFDDELLRAEYIFPHVSIEVSWSVPPARNPEKLNKWIPYSKVMECTFRSDTEVFHTKWSYDHKFHPIIITTLNGEEVGTPPMITNDWFGVLAKPKNCSFVSDDPLLAFTTARPGFFSRLFGWNVQRYRISTALARTQLWKSWKNGKEFDAVTTRWLDELSLRHDSILKPYWKARDWGHFRFARSYVLSQADTIMARIDLDPSISSWTPIAFKISDLSSFGQGGDTRINTRTQSSQLRDSDTKLHVLALDTGTWPNEAGGVSACRRDLVNNLQSIKWHVVSECANDFGVPRFQIEQNVQSLTVLPLWGLDFLTPTHGIFQNNLDSAVQDKSLSTRNRDIKKHFIPILRTLVRFSRAIKLDAAALEETGKALIALNTYFVSSGHWSDVWMSDVVKDEWRKLWLAEDQANSKPISQWLEAERPTLQHMDNALDMWQRYLFVFSLPVPERIPDVVQASHHFTGASFGVLCKLKRNCSLHVWDHCISWREVTVFLSSAMSFDSPFVRQSLIQLSRLACVLILHHADVVLPCADFFNPGWEVELGTQEGVIGHRRTYARKIDPVVNGITDMERFTPIEKIKSELPTVVMLSHVRFVKDIKNAILAADMIVNRWHIKDYRLHIYGDMEKAPTYTVECQEIIAAKGLQDNVVLKGLGSPSQVLETGWLFLNSSVSEGLPLAMGEAALTGVPVVCTDVGASFRVVTDIETMKRFSAVVAPNDCYSLAKAQVDILALLGEWSSYAGDKDPNYKPKLPAYPTPEDAKWIMDRMYEKQEYRRKLGMLGRDNVMTSFTSHRYLREHEQMLWIGKYQSSAYRSRYSPPNTSGSAWTTRTLNDGGFMEFEDGCTGRF